MWSSIPWRLKGNGETCLEMIILFMLKLEVGKGPSYQEWPSKILTSTTSGLTFQKSGIELCLGQGAWSWSAQYQVVVGRWFRFDRLLWRRWDWSSLPKLFRSWPKNAMKNVVWLTRVSWIPSSVFCLRMGKSISRQITVACLSTAWWVFSQYGMKLNGVWLDLHASDFEGNVMTEYEQKFSNKGQVIYRVEAEF